MTGERAESANEALAIGISLTEVPEIGRYGTYHECKEAFARTAIILALCSYGVDRAKAQELTEASDPYESVSKRFKRAVREWTNEKEQAA